MTASRIILLLVALLAGGLAAFLAMRGSAPQQVVVEGPSKIVEEQKDRILVAKAAIGVGQRLNTQNVEWQPWPELAVRPEYVSESAMPNGLTDVGDAVARFEFFPGEPIIESKLVHSNDGYLSAVLASGMRGVSVPVAAATAAGGYVMPNDRVDIVLSRKAEDSTISETILSNVKVLAIGTRLGEVNGKSGKGDGEAAGETKTADNPRSNVFQDETIAVLELTPRQGELVINATRIGRLSLALRSIADYAQTPQETLSNETSRAIRMIRFGRGLDVMPMNGGAAVVPASTGDLTADDPVPDTAD